MMKYHITFLIMLLFTSCVSKRYEHYESMSSHQALYKNKSWKEAQGKNYLVRISNQKYKARWWTNFNDKKLNAIVGIGIANNLDYQIAESRIHAARQKVSEAKASLLPEINASQNSSIYRGSNSSINSSNSAISTTANKKKIKFFSAGIDASWEIDFFEKNSNLEEAEKHKLYSLINEKKYFLSTLITDIVVYYIEYRKYQNLVSLYKELYSSQKEIAKLTLVNNKSGIVSQLDVNSEKNTLLEIESQLFHLKAMLTFLEYNLEYLCGMHPRELFKYLKEQQDVPKISTHIVAHSPMSVINNRPDIISASEDLIAANHTTKSAIAQQFPSVSIGGFLGYQDSNIIKFPTVWNIGQSLSMPIFNFNKIKSHIHFMEEQEKQSFIRYKKYVLNALKEVEQNISMYSNSYSSYNNNEEICKNQKDSFDLTEDLYNNHTVSYIDLSKERQKLLRSRAKALEAKSEYSIFTAKLFKSLGY